MAAVPPVPDKAHGAVPLAARCAAGDAPRALRRDAQRNRAMILEAARVAFAAQGLEASLETVARQAGVAIGTLYRHFPTRMHLIEAVFTEKAAAWVAAAEQALAIPDPWDGFAHYLERLCELQADDRGFNDVASMRLSAAHGLEETKDRAYRLSLRIVARARRSGALRPDASAEDIALVLWACSRITEATQSVAPQAWRRHLGLMLDAFRAENAHPLPVPPLRPHQVHAAMLALASGDSPLCAKAQSDVNADVEHRLKGSPRARSQAPE